ncbi:MAG TPA: hypothetical protein VGA37_16945 [Gemmatimonadales bacterium]
MTPTQPYTNPGRIVRVAFAVATILFAVAGYLAHDARLYVASGAFAVLWTLWDLVWDHVVAPFGEWVAVTLLQGGADGPPPNTRPTLEDTIRLLESHLASDETAPHVKIQAAIRLEEIYRTVKKRPDRASDVVRRISQRFPDAAELARFHTRDEEGGVDG